MNWHALGARLFTPIAHVINWAVGDRIRAQYAAKFGTCSGCERPLTGPSPDRTCEVCAAVFAGITRGLGDKG